MKLQSTLPLLALALIAFAGCTNPTADKSAAKITDAIPTAPAPAPDSATPTAPAQETAPVAPAPAARVFTFTNDGSAIDFTGYKVTGSHVGGFGKFSGSVTVPAEGPGKLQVSIEIDMNSTYSDAPDLTKVMKGEGFFEVTKYPKATFTSTSLAEMPYGFDVTGNLTLKDVTKGVTFPAEIKIEGDTLTAKAEFTIQRSQWNVTYAGMADDLIKEDVLLYFDIVAKLKPGA